MDKPATIPPQFFDRDISWLGFNAMVLEQALKPETPLLEKIKFLAIYSSNLDEFYRVRIPVLLAFDKMGSRQKTANDEASAAQLATQIVEQQLQKLGHALTSTIIPGLRKNDIVFWYNKPADTGVFDQTTAFFFSQVLAFLRPVNITKTKFYPKNNRLYFVLTLTGDNDTEELIILNIPSDKLPRFYTFTDGEKLHVLFLDDIIKYHLPALFKAQNITGCYSIKVTRDAELDLKDEYDGDIADQIEKQLAKRDFGYATRFLYQPGMPLRIFELLVVKFNLKNALLIEGGPYHNLKDLFTLPVKNAALSFTEWPPILNEAATNNISIFDELTKGDLMVHTPYYSYNNILRFFNEAAADVDVAEICVSLYRVASDSRIVNALISAVKNGKKVKVLVELKARFDEANNIKWAKKLKKAGAEIIYSITALKVHAKIALVKRSHGNRMQYFGLLGTGNFNEGTAKAYTDHILMTANPKLLREVELLFIFLTKRVKPEKHDSINFEHLLVSKFNLHDRFLEMIDREIEFAGKGFPASIIIKLNNIEERVLINKLYQASNAGVKISIICRGICCLVPGISQMSQNITITRIVDRYLEHGRVFIFNNNNDPEVYLGSADWMNRNIYHRIEVCFPVYDAQIKKQIINIIQIQLTDNTQAVMVDGAMNNVPVKAVGNSVQSQLNIYQMLAINTKSQQ